MATDEEKAEGARAEMTTSSTLNEQKEKSANLQGSPEDSFEKGQSDRNDFQNDHSSQDSDETVLESDKKQQQEAEPEAGGHAKALEKSPQRLEAVPRSQRRGFFGRFTLVPEVVNPYEYNNGTKWMMTIFVALAATTSSTGSSISYRERII